MEDKVRLFCEDIRDWYWKYMYSKNVDFPVCCRLSAVLITAYLQDCFTEDEYQCCFANQRFSLHGFTKRVSDEIIIDFTDFQFGIGDEVKENMKQHNYDEEKMLSLIKDYQVIVKYNDGCFGFHDFAKPIELSKYQLIREKRTLGIDEFKIFLEQNWQIAVDNVKYEAV